MNFLKQGHRLEMVQICIDYEKCTSLFRFEFVSIPLVHPRYKREFFRILPERAGPLTRSDKVLSGSSWSTLVVAKISPWIDLDSSDETIRKNSEKVPSVCSVHIILFYVQYKLVALWLCLLLGRNRR